MNTIKLALLFIGILLLSACASHIPQEIRNTHENAPTVAQVREIANSFLGQKVRWGGALLRTENKNGSSRLFVVAYELDSNGKPIISGKSIGRFIAVKEAFLEPNEYRAERRVTIIGKLSKTKTMKVDEYDYQYPVIQIEHVYLWPEVNTQQYDERSRFFYDPWNYPLHRGYFRHHSYYYPHNYFYSPYTGYSR